MKATRPQLEQFAKIIFESCISSKWFAFTQFSIQLKGGDLKNLSSDKILSLIESAPREAHEAAYYNIIDEICSDEWKFDDVVDELTISGHLSFDNIWVEDDQKMPGNSAWVRIATDDGFKVVHAKFVRMPLRNIVQKEHDFRREFHRMSNEIDKITATSTATDMSKLLTKLKNLNRKRIEHLILKRTNLAPVMAKIQRSKTRFDYVPITDVEIIDDQDMYDRLDQSRKSKHIKVSTIYNNNTKDQVHYLRSRGISKQRAEVMANLEGTSITYDINTMFREQA